MVLLIQYTTTTEKYIKVGFYFMLRPKHFLLDHLKQMHVCLKVELCYPQIVNLRAQCSIQFIECHFDQHPDSGALSINIIDVNWYPPSFLFQIHWFSIFNSFMMVIFLVGLVSMILMRTLRKDYQRYSKDEEMDDMV